jgi:uncharacterized membrane protein (UPF0127 family)
MRFVPLLILVLLTSCRSGAPTAQEDFDGTDVTLPNGKKILAESARTETMMMRGMMFRDSLAEDRGMLFTHGEPGNFSYWMFQVKIPLDILWLGPNKRIVEIVENAAPCPAKPCPGYGGKERALYVLELAGGSAKRNNLRVGDSLRF